jgi:hypothetical protein
MMGARRSDRRDPAVYVLVALALVALGLLVYFDLQTNLTLNDEYARRWTLQRLADGHGLALWGQNPGLVQIAASAPLALAHLEPRFWRLGAVPFAVLTMLASWRVALRMGADSFWAVVAGATIACSPIALTLATGMMNETVFLGLLVAGAWFSLRWIEEDRSRVACILAATLATAQRQQGLGIALALSLFLLLRNRRRWGVRDVAGIAGTWIGSLLALEMPARLLRGASVVTNGVTVQHDRITYPVFALVALPIMLGLFLLPFGLALVNKRADEARRVGRREMVSVALAFAGLIGGAKLVLALGAPILPGNILGPWGLGPTTLVDNKLDLFPAWLFVPFELVITATYCVILMRRRRAWNPAIMGTGRAFLLTLAASQLAVVLAYNLAVFDRYYLAVAAPLVPIVAAMASEARPRWRPGRAWAVGALAVGIGIYAVGEQDYLSWQVARDKAAQLAYAKYPAYLVDAGYEEAAQHVWIPAAEDPTHTAPTDVSQHPDALVIFTTRSDRRPGFDYSSLVPGRVVVVYLHPPP